MHLRPLLHLLEQHAEALVGAWREAIGRSPQAGCLHPAAAAALAQRLGTVFAQLADELGRGADPACAAAWWELGAAQRRAGVPVATLVHALTLARALLVRWVRRNDLVDTVFEADERDEAIGLIDGYFDAALYRAVSGWEEGAAA